MNGRASPDPLSAGGGGLNLAGANRKQGSQPLLGQSGQQQQLPQALQHLQRILQSQLASVNPLQLQQALQRQQVSIGDTDESF